LRLVSQKHTCKAFRLARHCSITAKIVHIVVLVFMLAVAADFLILGHDCVFIRVLSAQNGRVPVHAYAVVGMEVGWMSEYATESSGKVLVALGEKRLLRVLLVDDERSLLRKAQRHLEMQGSFQVDTASSVEEALKMLKKQTYDAVISEYQLPSRDGLEFLKELRQKGDETPFIMFTRRGTEEVAIKSLNLGADQYLNKSGEPEIVYKELAYAVQRAAERKTALKRVRESEERYRNLFELAPDAVLTLDMKGVVTSCNAATVGISGYPRDEIVGKHFSSLSFLHKEDVPRYLALFASIEGGKVLEPMEVKWNRKDGTSSFTEFHMGLIKEDDKTVGVQVIARDITERKRAEESLRESEEKFRKLAEQSPNMIFINKKGRVVYANRRAEEIMGYTIEEFCSPNFDFLTLIAPESRELVKTDFANHMRGEEVAPFAYKLLTKQGRLIDAILASKLITYEGELSILGTVTEITDHVRAMELVQENQRKFESLFMGNPEATAYLEPDFHILNVNPRFEELFGYSPAEVNGKHIDEVIVQSDKIEEARALNDKALEGYVYHNTVRRRKDGTLVPVSVSAAPINVEGRIAGVVAMYKDISDLKGAERKLEVMNEKLRVVGGLTRHDARNKLSIVLGNTYLIKRELSGNVRILDPLKEVENAVKQVVRIFDFAKAYEMLGAEQLAYIDTERTVQEAVSLFPGLKDVEVINDCRGLSVLADSLLRQLFYNLIDNSLKYGQKVSRIRVRYEKMSKGELKLVYEDDGVGISDADRPKLFKEGYSTGGSTGYGLYLIGKIVEVYGWTIQEAGTSGKGAQFTMIIPKKGEKGKENYQIRQPTNLAVSVSADAPKKVSRA
jgi:PAS domain S-box-containing protein